MSRLSPTLGGRPRSNDRFRRLVATDAIFARDGLGLTGERARFAEPNDVPARRSQLVVT